MKSIDLNSDLGESFGAWKMGDDRAMLEIVTSANIACGFHAGDPTGILKTIEAAKANNVVIGAHIGYRDLVGFGRRNVDATYDELLGDALYQIGALQGLAQACNMRVRYVKPHGALYNRIAHDMAHAKAVIDAICRIDKTLVLMALAGSPLIDEAKKAGLHVVAEAFADRGYNSDGSLVSRREKGATLHDAALVSERMLQLVTTGQIEAHDGTMVKIDAQSICLHGDNPDSVQMAKAIKQHLQSAGVQLRSFID